MSSNCMHHPRPVPRLRKGSWPCQGPADCLGAAAFEANPYAMCIVDGRGVPARTNAAWRDLAASHLPPPEGPTPASEAAGLFRFLCDNADGFQKGFDAVLRAGCTRFGTECALDSLLLRVTFSPIRLGRETLCAVCVNDVTQERAREEKFRWLARAVEQSPASIVITGVDGAIQYVNPRFEQATGYAAAEAIGRNPRVLKSGCHSPEFYRDLWARIVSGGEWRGEFQNRRKDGSLFWEQASISPARDDDGRITHYIAVKEDITERKAAEAALRQAKDEAEAANRAKSTFLATMSHELRTPLNVINGVTATLLEQGLPDELRSSVQLVNQSGESLLGIIEEILEFTRLQADRAKIDERPCDLSTAVFHALNTAAERARSRGIDLRCRISPAVPAEAVTDARRLQQVLVNLLSNAVKFTEHGHVGLEVDAARAGDGRWRIDFAVTDTGIGIDPGTMEHLFEPFRQGDSSATRLYGGSGLGLTIARSFVRLLGGDIACENRADQGSVFRFFILAAPTENIASLLAGGRGGLLDGRRALVAAALPSHGAYLETVLASCGMECGIVHHGHVLPGSFGPGSAFDLLVIEADMLPPGVRKRWDHLHVGAESPPVIWVSTDAVTVGDGSRTRSRTLRWPVSPADLQRAARELLGCGRGEAALAGTGAAAKTGPLGKRLPLRILAADDVRTNREVLRIIFKHLAYTPDFAENGAEVLEQLEQRSYDLVLLDVQMPVMDGLTAAREIRRLYPCEDTRPRIVALTANALPGDREVCLAAGMDDYLSKPVVPKQIEECFVRLFADRQTPAAAAPAAPAAPAPAPEAAPWVDHDHLAAITVGNEPAAARAFVDEIAHAFEGDFRILFGRIQQACAARDTKAAIEPVHGLKGGALGLGWRRLAECCVEALAALRGGTFTAWDTLPATLGDLYAESVRAMEAWRAGQPASQTSDTLKSRESTP